MKIDKENLQNILENRAVNSASHGMCEAYDYCEFCKEPTSFIRRSDTPCADAYEDMQNINKILKRYLPNKAKISTIKERIKIWEDAINSDEIVILDVPESTLGMPKAKYRISSPVEKEAEYKELDREKIKEMIKEEKSKLFVLETEVKNLDIAFSILPKKDMYLIECKYFEDMNWYDIEEAYNKKYNKHITEKRLRNKMTSIKKLILDIILQNGTKVG